jgi:hypothetical protein
MKLEEESHVARMPFGRLTICFCVAVFLLVCDVSLVM